MKHTMTGFGTLVDLHTVRFKRLLPGSIERVWSYLTVTKYLATWLAKGRIELRRGGRVDLRFDVDEVPERADGGAAVHGAVALCEPPRVLTYSWMATSSPPSPAESEIPEPLVTFELESRAECVLLVLTHRHLPTDVLARCGAGWHTHLDILTARLRNEEPKPFRPVWLRLLPMYERRVAMLTGSRSG